MYLEKTYHKNHVTEFPYRVKEEDLGGGLHNHIPNEGRVIQQGTPNNAQSRNKMEDGIEDAHVALSLLALDYYRQRQIYDAHNALMDSEVLGESHDVELTNKDKFPFNTTLTTPVSVALTKNRKNLFYSIETSVKTVEGGEVGEVQVKDKQLNGFKLSFTGSATKVVITARIKGGMT